MKANLEFDLNDPDDKQAHLRCVKALDMALALSTLREQFRQLEKERRGPIDQKHFYEVLHEYGLTMEELIS
jgi:hypothetical protein